MTKSETLLGSLLEERLIPGAKIADIDRRILDLFEEEWCVVYLRLAGPQATPKRHSVIEHVRQVHEFKRLCRPVFEANEGKLLKTYPVAFLVVFRRPHQALDSLLQVKQALAQYNSTRSEGEHLASAAGVGFGKVLKIGEDDVYGLEATLAFRLGEDEARSGQIIVSDATRAALVHTPGVEFEAHEGNASSDLFRVVEL